MTINSLVNAGVRILTQSSDFKSLQRLDLTQNALTNEGIELLVATGVDFAAEGQHNGNVADGDWLYYGDIE